MTKARDIASAAPAPSTVSATELGYLDGVTSAIQTQLNNISGSKAQPTEPSSPTDGMIWVDTDGSTTDANFIPKTLTSTTGDIIYASSANTPARLGIGSTSQVLTVSGGVPTWATPAAGGKVLQVVYSSTSTAASSTTASYVDTGLTASITPSSATSKVLVLFNHQECGKTGDTRMRMKLLRGATDVLQIAQNMGNTNSSLYYQWASMSASYLDEPNTTSSTTYKTQFNNQDAAGTTYVNGNGTCVSTIILMEIGA